jgi:calcineurin-like phosphoesterase
MRVIMIGDVVGEPGISVLEQRLPSLIAETAADFTVVNGENAADGFGLTAETLERILNAGADAVTGGNHIWEKREFWQTLDSDKPVLRPANYSQTKGHFSVYDAGGVPGSGWIKLEKNGYLLVVINLQGREYMRPIDCPFRCYDSIIEELERNSKERAAREAPSTAPGAANMAASGIIVDFHAESTEEKEALGYYLDGRAAIVAGTHTHIQTADERILPKGTAYITDLGMTGATNGVIGMDTKICMNRAFSQVAYRMECAKPNSEKDCAMQGIIAEMDNNGKAISIERINR